MHAVRALLVVQPLGPSVHRELRGVVGADPRAPDAAGDRADVHDRTRRRAPQERQQRLGHADGRVEVLIHDLAHVLIAVVGVAELPALPVSAGVVDQQVEAIELRLSARRDPRRRGRIGQVSGFEHRAPIEVAGERLQAVGPPGNEEKAPAIARETARECLTDTTRRTGDHRRLRRAGSVGRTRPGCARCAHSPSTRATKSGNSRAIRERGTTMSKPASSARRFSSGCTCG